MQALGQQPDERARRDKLKAIVAQQTLLTARDWSTHWSIYCRLDENNYDAVKAVRALLMAPA